MPSVERRSAVQRRCNCCLTCRGYGFVKFGEESEQKKAIEECQGTMLGGKPLRLSIAVAKRCDCTRSPTHAHNDTTLATSYLCNELSLWTVL